MPLPLLSVNVDHVATLRQARYRGATEVMGAHAWGEPDVARAFHEAELGGADGITVHLREDRRHVTDRDVMMLGKLVRAEFNLEMGATGEMVEIACRVKPHSAMLVPEGRNEVTTEGGLDVVGKRAALAPIVAKLRSAGCRVSAFIDADASQVEAAADLGFDICEIHTGPYAHAFAHAGGSVRSKELANELARVQCAMELVVRKGMGCNAGHALNYANVAMIARLLRDVQSSNAAGVLHIGHSIISRAIFVGLRAATSDMKHAISLA
jgi:pyridoxine 5-phosphate synthase